MHIYILPIKSSVPQGGVLGHVIYLFYTADLLTTVSWDFLATHEDSAIATYFLQNNLNIMAETLSYAGERKKVSPSPLLYI